jgi:DNA-binding MarR family transcriptional regulator
MSVSATARRAGSARATQVPSSVSLQNPPSLGCTGAQLRRLTRRVTAFYEHHMRDSGLKFSQYSLLAQLSEEPRSLTALADRMEIDRTTLTRSLQPLLDLGFVGESSGTDARRRLFALTRSGLRMRTETRKQWREAQTALAQHLGADFITHLHTQLELALSRLKPGLPEDN